MKSAKEIAAALAVVEAEQRNEEGRVNPVDDPREYNELPADAKAALARWIQLTFVPVGSAGSLTRSERGYVLGETSYSMKHLFENHRFYVTNGQFKGAMLAAGHNPTDKNKQNCTYRVAMTEWGKRCYRGAETHDEELNELVQRATALFSARQGGYHPSWWTEGNGQHSPLPDAPPNVHKGAMTMEPYLKLYRDGKHFGISTNIAEEENFWDHFAKGLHEACTSDEGEDVTHTRGWTPLAFEIVAKIRGYKSTVSEYRVFTAGDASWEKATPKADTAAGWSPTIVPAAK